MLLPAYLWCRGVGEHAAQGHRRQTSGGTLSKSQDRGRGGEKGGGGPVDLVGPEYRVSGAGSLGGGTEEEPAGGGGGHVLYLLHSR